MYQNYGSNYGVLFIPHFGDLYVTYRFILNSTDVPDVTASALSTYVPKCGTSETP